MSKNLDLPDETIRFPGIVTDLVDLGDLTVGRSVQYPGWRWSTHTKPLVGGDWCKARHIGIVLSGSFGVDFPDGSSLVLRPNDVYEISPGHDGYTIGNEECVLVEWSGLRTFAGFRSGARGRLLTTVMFTDLVDSTSIAARLGDVAWRETLSAHYEAARMEFERFGGHEIKTTGDGMLVTFESPALALRCAAALRDRAERDGLRVRAGVHTGEVDVVGDDIRGITVHVAARVIGLAGPGEILASEPVRMLAPDMRFDERGAHALKGVPGEWALYAFAGEHAT